jgi:hypothetical protein
MEVWDSLRTGKSRGNLEQRGSLRTGTVRESIREHLEVRESLRTGESRENPDQRGKFEDRGESGKA